MSTQQPSTNEIIDLATYQTQPYLIYFKIGCILIITFVSLLFGLIPLFCNIKKSSKLLGFANAFSGGLFMGIGLFHLLPEAGENFESYYATPEGQKSIIFGQPLSYFIAFISYSLILFLEKVAFNSHALTAHTHGEGRSHVHHDDLDEPLLNEFDEEEPLQGKDIKNKNDLADEFFNDPYEKNKKVFNDYPHLYYPTNRSSDNVRINKIFIEENDSDEDENTLKNVLSSKGQFASFLQTRNILKNINPKHKMDKSLYAATKIIERTTQPQPFENCEKCDNCESKNKLIEVKINKNDNNKNENNQKSNFIPKEDKHNFTPTSVMTPYILLIALSLHGLFEGSALGVMHTLKNTIFLLLAILAHKWAESFALGISFFKSGTEKGTFIKMIVIFSLFTPIGIIIGLLFAEAGNLIQGILLSISGGTFLYVSASEVIVEEFSVTKYKYRKYLFYLLGGILVGILKIFEVEE